MKNTIKEPVLLVDSRYGVYVPQTFVEQANEEILKQIPEELKKDLLEGPDCEWYWDSWDTVLNITFKVGTQKFILDQNDDLWLIPLCYTRTKEFKENWNI